MWVGVYAVAQFPKDGSDRLQPLPDNVFGWLWELTLRLHVGCGVFFWKCFVAWPKHGSPGLAYPLWCWFRISKHWAVTLPSKADVVLSSWSANVLIILHSSLQHVTSPEGKSQQSQSFPCLSGSSMVFTQIFSFILSFFLNKHISAKRKNII